MSAFTHTAEATISPDPDLERNTMDVSIDTDKCIASGGCVFACPEVFDQDDDGIVVLLDAKPDETLRDKVLDAIDACPAAVITVS